jgi:Dockerin type I domain
MSDRPDNQEQEPAAPARLVEELRALHNQRLIIPRGVDETILSQAWAHLKEQPERRQLVRFPRWLAAAAVAMLAAGLVFLLTRHGGVRPTLAREDIDRNGQVDILDAFALARKLQLGATSDSALDVNGDGIIDQRDIDWIAARAVKLHKG